MFRKSLLLAFSLCLLTAPLAMANGSYNSRQAASAGQTGTTYASSYGLCTKGVNGTGEIINWVKNEGQCRHNTNGESWVENGVTVYNYHRGN